jgi:dCTP deaminase
MKIGQLSFLRMSTPVDRPYGSPGLRSKYQGQMTPTPSRAYTEFKES